MKENKYDDPAFFERYRQMSRSVEGLEGAGEWHELKKLLPVFQGKRVLDLGCGFGWHCAYAARNGAEYVLGIDISSKMIEQARKLNGSPHIEYIVEPIEDYLYPLNTFDIVISSLAFHYLDNITELFKKIHRTLKEGGGLVFSTEHPVFTAEGTQQWNFDSQGGIQNWPVDRYFQEGKREAVFLGEQTLKYHRTVATYLNTLLESGFTIERVIEPVPDPAMMHLPGMIDELRRPMFLIVSAMKR